MAVASHCLAKQAGIIVEIPDHTRHLQAVISNILSPCYSYKITQPTSTVFMTPEKLAMGLSQRLFQIARIDCHISKSQTVQHASEVKKERVEAFEQFKDVVPDTEYTTAQPPTIEFGRESHSRSITSVGQSR